MQPPVEGSFFVTFIGTAKNALALFLIIPILALGISYSASASPEVNQSGADYLKTKDPSAWSTMALVTTGEQNINGDHLKAKPGDTAISYTVPIMAISAMGENPSTFPDEDFVATLKAFYDGNQIGDVNTNNDDIFGIIALRAAGEPIDDTVVSGAKTFLLNQQNTDGGWGFSTDSGTSDTNMTAMAIMALVEAGLPASDSVIENALSSLRSAQNDDGGFPYDPESPWGTDSDASSDAWVISALYSLGIDAESWEKNGNNPVEHLKSLQAAEGYFQYQSGSGEDAFSPVTTSYSVIALAGYGYPIREAYTPSSPTDPAVTFHIEGSNGLVCRGNVTSATALDVVVNAEEQCGYTYTIEDTSYGPYLSQINNDKAEGLNGWMYMVNKSQPGVGAADYALTGGDFVLWYFGAFGDEPPVISDNSQSVSLDVNIIDSSSGPGPSQDVISFSVNPESLSFGDVSPGSSSSDSLTITNSGNVDIRLEALVSGDDVFTDNLELSDVHWSQFTSDVDVGSGASVDASLDVPSDYSSIGNKSGSIIFWAVAK